MKVTRLICRCASLQVVLPVFAIFVLPGLAGDCAAQITVRLHREPVVSQREVRLDDIATITAASPRVMAAIGSVDVASIPLPEVGTTVSSSFIRIRLMLAGWQKSALVVEGPEAVLITYEKSHPVTDVDVERAARDAMLIMPGTDEDNLQVRLTDVFMATLSPQLRERGGLRVEVSSPVRAQLGQVSMRVRVWKGENVVAQRVARFRVMKRQRVAVTRVSLQRDSIIEEGDVQFENRFLSTVADEPKEADVYGYSVRSAIGSGKILSLRDLRKPVQRTRNGYAVKTRDSVRVTAVGNGLKIRLAKAEALESGRVGQTIRLRNSVSNKEIFGRVVEAGEVVINMAATR
jgi:flagellar basal body P-ring formation protein FlgA